MVLQAQGQRQGVLYKCDIKQVLLGSKESRACSGASQLHSLMGIFPRKGRKVETKHQTDEDFLRRR